MSVDTLVAQKGGVGKTTVALGMIYERHRRGQTVLAIDLDPQANLTSALDLDQPDAHIALTYASPHTFPLQTIIQTTPWCDLAPGHLDLGNFANAQLDMTYLRALLDPIRNHYDTIIIDTPPNLGTLPRHAMVATDRLYIITQPAYFAVKAMNPLLDVIVKCRKWRHVEGVGDLTMGGVIINMVDGSPSTETRARCNELENGFGTSILPFIPKRKAAETMAPRHEPVWISKQSGWRKIDIAFTTLIQTIDNTK